MFHDIQIVIILNFVVVSNVSLKRVDYTREIVPGLKQSKEFQILIISDEGSKLECLFRIT